MVRSNGQGEPAPGWYLHLSEWVSEWGLSLLMTIIEPKKKMLDLNSKTPDLV
jgi:hypothetical protein